MYAPKKVTLTLFIDVSERNVEVLAIVLKSEAATWLAKHGKSESK
jgi:hypothetical protein